MGFMSSFLERVIHIQLHGQVNLRMTENLLQALKYKNYYSVKLIAVSINSAGGSIVQAKNVNSILKKFSQQTGAPVYTFAESMSLNAANIILTGGHKCYANKFSVLGDFGFYTKRFSVKELMNDWKVEGEYIAEGKNKVKLNPFEDIHAQDGEWLQDLLKGLEGELKTEIQRNRGSFFEHKGINQDTIESEIFKSTILTGENAAKYGLIDGVNTLNTILGDKYDGIKRIDASKRSRFEDRVPKTQVALESFATN